MSVCVCVCVGVVGLTLILNIFRVRKIDLKSIFIMVSVCECGKRLADTHVCTVQQCVCGKGQQVECVCN